jgi:tetratricopeptide (TPR) repeat protein
MIEGSTSIEIFCCYAHEDEVWLRQLEIHLSLLKRQGLLSLWHDRCIIPGTDWGKTIDTHLETASVILLLVSADFFASDYCYGIEMKRALAREAAGEARVIPILVRPVDWTTAPFAYLQSLPTDARPIVSWQSTDTALADIAAGIRRVIVEELPQFTASAPRAALPNIWNIPYPRNPFFLGRDAELFQIRSHLLAGQTTALSQPQAISGLGGVGKTQLALEYAYRYYQDYQAILWASAESAESLVSSYVALANLLQLPEREAKEQEVTVQAVKHWLQKHSGWLLVLDNADDLAIASAFLPPHPGGHILLTTRAAATGQLAHRLEITTLGPEQGALFLLRRAGLLPSDASLEQITQELGDLPLALDQAGAYLEETGTSLGAYWQLYQEYRSELLHQRRGVGAGHPLSVATTWSLSFQRIEECNPAAADLLRLLAWLSPDAIAEEVLAVGAAFLGPRLSTVAENAWLLNQAIEVIRAYSLIQRDPKEKMLSMHRLVQSVLRDQQDETERPLWIERGIRAINATFPQVTYTARKQCERLLPLAQTGAQRIEREQLFTEESGRLLFETASYLLDCGRYAEAEPLYQRALHIREQQLGPEHAQVADVLYDLAQLNQEQGKYEEAERLCRQALSIREQQLGPEHAQVADVLYRLASLCADLDEPVEAELLYRQALSIWQKQLGPEHRSAASVFNSLAILYSKQGRYTETESLFQQALSIWQKQLGPEHPSVASVLSNLANFYLEQSRYAEAEPLYQRLLHIWRQPSGRLATARMASALDRLAFVYTKQGKYAQAKPLYQRELSICEHLWNPEDRMVVRPLTGLANLYREQGKYAEAETLYQRALQIREQQLGPVHSETAEIIHEFARFQEMQGSNEEARAWYARALAVREQALGRRHPKTMETRTCLIALLHRTDQHEQAAQLEAIQSES